MSRAGQNTFTGISDQADITLLYLLHATKKPTFQKIIIEGKNWDDFTLIFNDAAENYEVKSYAKEFTYSDIRKILRKSNKSAIKGKFKIIVRRLNPVFKKVYENIYNYFKYIEQKGLTKDTNVKKLLEKEWSLDEVKFLSEVEIAEFNEIKYIHQQIAEYFAYTNPFYFDSIDQKSIVSQFFKEIMEKGKHGGEINQTDFQSKLDDFIKHISDSPTPIDPRLPIGKSMLNLNDFTNLERINELNRKTYLSQLTLTPRLIFYLADRLENNDDLSAEDFSFFINKVLLKQRYIILAFRILEKKWEKNKVSPEYLLDFVISHYKNLSNEFDYDYALKLLKSITLKDESGMFDNKIIEFLKKEILSPFTKDKKKRFQRDRRGWREDDVVAELLGIFLKRVRNKRKFIEFIFDYFDFTSDDFDNVIETHPLIYSFVKDYIKTDWKKNFVYVIKKISNQFNIQYNNKYKGYEWIGSGIGGWGNVYSITDKGMVRLLFQPLFYEFYQKDPKKAWTFFKSNILNVAKMSATKNNPVYLKRALVPILLDRLQSEGLNKRDKQSAHNYLKNILSIKKGIPGTSEIIFSDLRSRDLSLIGFERIMELISIDSIKYKRKDYEAGYPTNLFVIETLIKLIKLQFKPAKDFFLDILKKPDYIKRDQREYNTFELLSAQEIPANDPIFIVEIFKNFDFESYLNFLEEDIVWDKSGIILGLIKQDWLKNTQLSDGIVDSFLKNKVPGKKVLEFLAGPIRDLAHIDSKKTYNLLSPYLEKNLFRKTFQNSSHMRETIASIGEDLVKDKHYLEAQKIVEICIDDPDPVTDEEHKYNYHLKIKRGEKESGISTVRGRLAWVLQRFAITNDQEMMAYSFKQTKVLLDLDGSLAKKLGYKESDLYVRKQALVSFLELCHPSRRKKLNEYEAGLGDEVKNTAFQVLNQLNEQFKMGEAHPAELVEYLLHVFSFIRDLNVQEAKQVLEFFEAREETDSYFLWLYFAEFIEDPNFDSSYFRRRLEEMCFKQNAFRESIARGFWRMADNDANKNTADFQKIEKYWKLLFSVYDRNVFEDVYRTLDVTLRWPAKYQEHKEIFKKMLKDEVGYYINAKQSIDLWNPGHQTFNVFFEHSQDDYLEILLLLLENIRRASVEGINISYTFMRNWLNLLKSANEGNKELKDKIYGLVNELYPEYK